MTEQHQRLQKARSEAGFKNSTEASRFYGWNENTYRSYENGNRNISIKAATRFSDKFNVRVEWLLYGTGPMREEEEYKSEAHKKLVGRIAVMSEKQLQALLGVAETME